MEDLRLIIAISLAKLAGLISRMIGRSGTSLPGSVALKIYPEFLKKTSAQFKIILVTGTNGKTTTTGIMAKILESANIRYTFNKSGANLLGGIASTFLNGLSVLGKNKCSHILLEIDEAVFAKSYNHIQPHVIIITNFFRDQLDRYGQTYNVLEGVRKAIENMPLAKLVLNADDSLCASLGRNVANKVVYYGIPMNATNKLDNRNVSNADAQFCIYCQDKYEYTYNTYGHLGDFKCTSCGFERPKAQVSCSNVYEMTDTYSNIDISVELYPDDFNVKLNLPGLFNVYNALGATAGGIALDIPLEIIIPALSEYTSGFGRMEEINANGKIIKVILVKNSEGFNQTLNYLALEKNKIILGFILNNMPGDGLDTSWLWDLDLESLRNIDDRLVKILISGSRGSDMGVRLKYSDVSSDIVYLAQSNEDLLDMGLLDMDKDTRFYILPSYTAMMDIRSILQKRYKLKAFWK